jgi:hypothetical protein
MDLMAPIITPQKVIYFDALYATEKFLIKNVI